MADNIPTHVSIIMDGNGRWARERGMERVHGHFEGVRSVRSCAEQAVKRGVKYLSLFAFSEENWGRPQAEVDALMSLMMKSISEEVSTLMQNGVRFLVRGNRERLPKQLNDAISALEETTAGNREMTLVVFLSYSGKWDIFQAARRMAEDMAAHPDQEFDQNDFDKYLVTSDIPDPDLIIRTSGEKRLSNYLLWQSAYSEFLFVDTMWPDFKEKEFDSALSEFAKRDRRYGKVK